MLYRLVLVYKKKNKCWGFNPFINFWLFSSNVCLIWHVAGMLLLFTKQLIQVFIFKVKPIGIRDFFFHHFFLTQVLNIFQWTRHHFMTLHVITVHRNCFCASSIWMRHKRLQYVVFYKRGFCKDCHLKLCLKTKKYMYY